MKNKNETKIHQKDARHLKRINIARDNRKNIKKSERKMKTKNIRKDKHLQ